jgi:hypothetical protein
LKANIACSTIIVHVTVSVTFSEFFFRCPAVKSDLGSTLTVGAFVGAAMVERPVVGVAVGIGAGVRPLVVGALVVGTNVSCPSISQYAQKAVSVV